MKRRKRRKKLELLRLWVFADVKKALPLLRSILNTLRDEWLELQQAEVSIRRLKAAPGRDDKERILAKEHAEQVERDAKARFNDALEELGKLHVFLLDPLQGRALAAFQINDELAWFVFDLFDESGIVGWRMHADPLEMVRPLSELKPEVCVTS